MVPFETHLGRIASELGDLTGAKAHLERALRLARAAYGEDNLITSDAINNVAAIMLLQGGDDERAIELAERGIAIGERLGSRRLHGMMLSLGTVYLDTGNVKQGLPLLQRVLAMREEIYGAESSELLRPLIILGMASADAKDLDSARGYWGRAVAILDRMPAPPDFGVDLMRDYAKIVEDPRARRLMLADADALERRLAARAKLASKR
jgi:tetratricopeptide (TPR) repeat protein